MRSTVADLQRAVTVELLDGRGEVLARVPAAFVPPRSLQFTPPTNACAERAWTIRALDAAGQVLNETPTALGEAMRRMRLPDSGQAATEGA